mmetsp:Transcript_27716/g.69799  ORF Transcript_27716/g.69799 Transcript_27716/m.69799 type:complete len:236 (+) Transcript_27716:890-1597(+)
MAGIRAPECRGAARGFHFGWNFSRTTQALLRIRALRRVHNRRIRFLRAAGSGKLIGGRTVEFGDAANCLAVRSPLQRQVNPSSRGCEAAAHRGTARALKRCRRFRTDATGRAFVARAAEGGPDVPGASARFAWLVLSRRCVREGFGPISGAAGGCLFAAICRAGACACQRAGFSPRSGCDYIGKGDRSQHRPAGKKRRATRGRSRAGRTGTHCANSAQIGIRERKARIRRRPSVV